MQRLSRATCLHALACAALSLLHSGTTLCEEAFSLDDIDTDIERLRAVNDGQLQFITAASTTAAPVHTETVYTLQPDSLASGWVAMHQCQRGLDPLERVDIEYDYRELRDLTVTETQGVSEYRVEDQRVQLHGVDKDAAVCVSAWVRILKPDADGVYRLCSGPYHRRFLDGYFPLRLSLRIEYPPGLLSLLDTDPPIQPGLALTTAPDAVQLNAQFTGRLLLRLRFTSP